MQIDRTSYTIMAPKALKTGNNLPSSKVQDSPSTQERSTIRELATSIDPSNMSRNDAAAIGDALARSGDTELGMFFLAQSMVLVNKNGRWETATETDAIMNEKFNMFDSLKSQMEISKSKNTSTDTLESAMKFLEKFQLARATPEVNLYT